MKKLIIFDLDGTLLNTIADLAESTNYALNACGFPTHKTDNYNEFVGNGINRLFERALPEEARNEENITAIRNIFIPYYDQHNMDLSSPYPGIVETLMKIQEEGILLAVASNKYQAATAKLVEHFFPNIQFAAVFGQRDGIAPKPDPTIIDDILNITQIEKNDVLYVGDSGVDMLTAFNSGIESVGVTWGFRPESELLKYDATHLVHQAKEILELV